MNKLKGTAKSIKKLSNFKPDVNFFIGKKPKDHFFVGSDGECIFNQLILIL